MGTTIPSVMFTNQTRTVSVTMKNTGVNTWTNAAGYSLGSQNPQDTLIWGLNRVLLPGTASIDLGESYTFTFDIRSPSTPGTYSSDWKMVQDPVEWLGATCNKTVVVMQGTVPTTVPLPNEHGWFNVKHNAHQPWSDNLLLLGQGLRRGIQFL
jgi:hypothetical protein